MAPRATTSVVQASKGYPAVPAEAVGHLADRYGGEARALMTLIKDDPSSRPSRWCRAFPT